MFQYALILMFALAVSMVNCDNTAIIGHDDSICQNYVSREHVLVRDPKNPHGFYHCVYGKIVGESIPCQIAGEVFDDGEQTCIAPIIVDKICPSADGTFDYPGNPHKFLVCYQGHAYEFTCAANTVWKESSRQCVN